MSVPIDGEFDDTTASILGDTSGTEESPTDTEDSNARYLNNH